MKTLFEKQGWKHILFAICLTSLQLNTSFGQARNEAANSKSHEGFLENKCQFTDMAGKPVPNVLFKAQFGGINVWITTSGITYQTFQIEDPENLDSIHAIQKKLLKWERIDLTLNGAHISKSKIITEKPMAGSSNFFLPHCPQGIQDVKRYETIIITDIYPGIDWKIYYKNSSIKYDFIVHPEADYHQIKLLYLSKNKISISDNGNLHFATSNGDFEEKSPISFFKKKQIKTAFIQDAQMAITKNGESGFETSLHFQVDETKIDKSADLIIDPDLVWGTYVGSSYHDGITSVEATPTNEVIMTGHANSYDFPFVDPGNGAYFQDQLTGDFYDVFIMKFSAAEELIWSTYIGGNDGEMEKSMIFDHSGNIYITGETTSTVFPTYSIDGNAYLQPYFAGGFSDLFIVKFSGSGQLLWSTLYGGENDDCANALAIDSHDNIFVGGYSQSIAFPTQALASGGFIEYDQIAFGDMIILKFSNTGERLWATYYGGNLGETVNDMVCNSDDHLLVIGHSSSTNFPTQTLPGALNESFQNGDYNSYILRFDENGNRVWSTILGGWFNDEAYSIILDDNDNFYITGITDSPNFPLLNPGNGAYFQDHLAGWSDVFISKFNPNGKLLSSTFFGGSKMEGMMFFHPYRSYDKLDIDDCGNLTVAFETASNNVPVKKVDNHSYFDNTFSSYEDVFIARFCPSGELLWGTYLGGNSFDAHPSVEIDRSGNLYVTCYSAAYSISTASPSYPLKDPGGNSFFSVGELETSTSLITKFNNNTGHLIVDTIYTADCEDTGGVKIKVRGLCLPLNYIWSNGTETLNTTTLSNTITGLEAGTYTVVVEGVCGMLTETIEVPYFCIPEPEAPAEKLEFPNVLTPNDDNVNDLFLPIIASGLSEYELVITNRWGEVVFVTDDLNFGWNGKNNDKICSEGVYFWKSNYKTISGVEATVSGNVTLIK